MDSAYAESNVPQPLEEPAAQEDELTVSIDVPTQDFSEIGVEPADDADDPDDTDDVGDIEDEHYVQHTGDVVCPGKVDVGSEPNQRSVSFDTETYEHLPPPSKSDPISIPSASLVNFVSKPNVQTTSRSEKSGPKSYDKKVVEEEIEKLRSRLEKMVDLAESLRVRSKKHASLLSVSSAPFAAWEETTPPVSCVQQEKTDAFANNKHQHQLQSAQGSEI